MDKLHYGSSPCQAGTMINWRSRRYIVTTVCTGASDGELVYIARARFSRSDARYLIRHDRDGYFYAPYYMRPRVSERSRTQ